LLYITNHGAFPIFATQHYIMLGNNPDRVNIPPTTNKLKSQKSGMPHNHYKCFTPLYMYKRTEVSVKIIVIFQIAKSIGIGIWFPTRTDTTAII